VFSPQGDRVLTNEPDLTVRVWDLNGNQIAALPGDWEHGWKNPISPDGKYTLILGHTTATVWDLKGNKIGDVSRNIPRTSENNIPLWDAQGTDIAKPKKESFHLNTRNDFMFSSNRGQFIRTGQGVTKFPKSPNDITFLLWDSQGKQLAIIEGDRDWFQQLNIHNVHTPIQYSPTQLSVDGKRIATLGYDGKVRIWDSKGQPIAEYEGYAMALSPDGNKIVIVSKDNIPRLWRVDDLDGLLKRGCDWLNPDSLLNPQICDTSPLWRQWNEIRREEFKKAMNNYPQYFVRQPANYTKFAYIILSPRLRKEEKKREKEAEKHEEN
jgi:WD40 repeat protein